MPTQKTASAANLEEVRSLRHRVSVLSDRVLDLENNLKRTQERIQRDMTRLVGLVDKRKQ